MGAKMSDDSKLARDNYVTCCSLDFHALFSMQKIVKITNMHYVTSVAYAV